MARVQNDSKLTLTTLLLSAAVIDNQELELCQEQAMIFGKSRAALLFEEGMVSETVLSAAIKLMALVNEGSVSESLAIMQLRDLNAHVSFSLESIESLMPDSSNQLHLGELLSMAELIGPCQLAIAIMDAEELSMRLGQSLVLSGKLSANHVIKALQLQEQIRNASISLGEGLALLSNIV